MRGVELCGSARRLKHMDYGQCVEVRVIGTLSALSDFEEFLQSGNDESHWEFDEMFSPESKRTMPHNEFRIIPSGRGALCGENSDTSFDYVSAQSGSSNKSVGKVSADKKYKK
jgi:hypothetical protein